MPKYLIGFQSVEIEAENLVSAAHRALSVVPVVNELFARTEDFGTGSVSFGSSVSEAIIAKAPISAGGYGAPISAEAAQDRRANDVSASDQSDAPDGDAHTFSVGSSYKSDTGKWTGKVVSDDGDGEVRVDLTNNNTGGRETRIFEITDNGNLRSVNGNIVLRAKNKVG